jgi:hypothetical protein
MSGMENGDRRLRVAHRHSAANDQSAVRASLGSPTRARTWDLLITRAPCFRKNVNYAFAMDPKGL